MSKLENSFQIDLSSPPFLSILSSISAGIFISNSMLHTPVSVRYIGTYRCFQLLHRHLLNMAKIWQFLSPISKTSPPFSNSEDAGNLWIPADQFENRASSVREAVRTWRYFINRNCFLFIILI